MWSTMSPPLFALTLAAALGSAAVAGVFVAFSTFVMDGLARRPPAEGMAAMQSINVTAVRPPFMLFFLGTALLCAALVVAAVVTWGDRRAALLLAGALLYLGGNLAVTVARNVPMNDALAALEPGSPAAAADWSAYLDRWTAWNHVRAATGLAAAAALTLALAE
jgi:uncharacterized membrane protein